MRALTKVCICGSEPRLQTDGNNRYWLVKCDDCGRASIHCRTSEEAVEAWNGGTGS